MDKKRIHEKRAIELLKQALNEITHLKELHHDNQEVKLWHVKVFDIIDAGLDAYDKVAFLVGGAKSVDVRSLSDSARQKHYLEDLEGHETALKSIIQKYEILGKTVPTSKVPSEAVYSSGTPYDAYKDIKDIIILAANKLIIVDPYVDGTVVTLLENAKPSAAIQVLTRKIQGDFQLAAQKFKQQREMAGQGSLEMRRDKKSFHDRFIVSDDKFFHLGASIKDAGIKVFAINEIEDSRNKSVLGENIRKAWDAAEKVL